MKITKPNPAFKKLHTVTINIIRHGRRVPVKVTSEVEYDGGTEGSWCGTPGVRYSPRRFRLNYRELDRAWFASLSELA